MREQLYQAPSGFVDVPFIYTFEGAELTPGSNPTNLIVSIEEEDFILRSVAGMSNIATDWKYYNYSQLEAMNDFTLTADRWTVVPEKMYPMQSQIRVDLQNVALAVNADGNNNAYAGFVGAKRVPRGQWGWAEYESAYDYYEAPFAYNLPFTLDYFADQGAAARQFNVEISNADFELQAIAISRTDTPGSEALVDDPFRMTLYDPSGYNALSTGPISPRWVNWLQGGLWGSSYPCPTMVYPIQSRMKVAINSLINVAGGAQDFEITFVGVERRPC